MQMNRMVKRLMSVSMVSCLLFTNSIGVYANSDSE